MASWDLRRLQMHLQKGTPQTIYLLVGEDYFLMNEALTGIKAAVLTDGAIDFNSDQFFAGDDDVIKIRDTIEMLPMMSPRRLVVVRNVQSFKEKDWDVLAPIFDQPVDSTTLVLLADKVDKRRKTFKRLAETSTVVELSRPYDNQLAAWIDYIGAKHGLTIQNEAAALLRQLIGASLTELNNEVLKLRDFVGPRKSVDAEDVLKVVSRSKADSVFDLTNAIGRQDRAMALQSLAHLLEHGQNEIGAVAMIARHIRILSAVRDGVREGMPPTKLCLKAGIPQFFLKDYQSQARLWSDSKITQMIHALKDTDKALKSSPVSSHIWLENFILKACQL
ncbi:MAG: DNA polymerase III subunit delta [Bdellovibrionales bacterium]